MGLAGASVFASTMTSGCSTMLPFGQESQTPLVPEWTGDSFGPMHRIRDAANFPVPKPHRKVDVVIVGGGLSALTAAYQLREENFLLLERETELGGNAKQGEYQGIKYALGSAYIADINEPFGSFYDTLGIHPKPVNVPVDLTRLNGQWQSLEKSSLAKPYEKLRQHLGKLLDSPDFPIVPIHAATPQAMRLDKLSFLDYLKQLNMPQELLQCVDAYCYSALGGGIKEISAYAGVNFYSEIAGNIYAFPGGNAYIAQTLTSQIRKAGQNRIQSGVSVYHVAQQGDQVLTSYFLNDQPEQFYTVASRAAIVCVPYFFAGRIIQGLSDHQKAVMQGMQYGSYLVANCCFNQRVYEGGYDNWVVNYPGFTDFIVADHVVDKPKQASDPMVLTIYAPYRNALSGRMKLFQGDRQAIAAELSQSLESMIAYPKDSLKEIRLTRYGHQMTTSRVGLIQTLAGLQKQVDRIFIAHSDGQGMAAIESALTEALLTVPKVKTTLTKSVLPVIHAIS